MIEANNPALRSWIEVAQDCDFPIQNIPFGVFQTADKSPRLATIIGEQVIDLHRLAELKYFEGLDFDTNVFSQNAINDFMALGRETTAAVRQRISELFRHDNASLRDNTAHRAETLHPVQEVQLLLPVRVGDYTDFYSSRDHATNVGTMFRDPDNALLPNWLHIPVGYHGRASSIIPSGQPIHRPKGQTKPNDAENPVFGPSRLLDFELEVAFVVGKNNELGSPVTTETAESHIFGLVLFNDWSARDIQKWEYVPLGPFLAKSFASTISPWVVTLDALAPFRVAGPTQEPEVLPYLKYEGDRHFDINLEVAIQPEKGEAKVVCESNFKYMYWNIVQQLAHHTVNGCNLRVGDMCASGTISGPEENSFGSMLEITWRGSKPIQMPDGSERKFINDGDTVKLRGFGIKDGVRIGFGPCDAKVLPAK